jgi:putative tricarboxylic transport membrane protein
MRRADQISSVVLIAVSIVVCFASIRIGLGTFNTPDLGFVPFFAGVFLGLTSLPTLIKATLGKKSEIAAPQERVNLRKVIKAYIGLILYVAFLPLLGYPIGTFLLMLFFFKGVETMKWRWAVLTGTLIVLGSYLIFDVWLQCMLPVGFVDIRWLTRWII